MCSEQPCGLNMGAMLKVGRNVRKREGLRFSNDNPTREIGDER